MTVFLTSSPSGCPYEPGPEIPVLDTRNRFVENLRAVWPATPPLALAIASDPNTPERNDEMCRVFLESFARAGLPLADFVPCDARNQEEIGTLLAQAGFVMLSGGHVPTQNHFFAQIGLPALLQSYQGIVMGVSAGSMNAARTVYAQPEEPGEATDPAFGRWLPGLGLTQLHILPHYQFTRDLTVDGQRTEDIALAESFKAPLLALADGSYLLIADDSETLLIADDSETLYGEAWYLADGRIEPLNADGEVLSMR